MIEISLAAEKIKKKRLKKDEKDEKSHFVIPGDVITDNSEYIRGHGTFMVEGSLKSSVVGVVSQADKLISVHPLKGRYEGQPGQVVVGRILEVAHKRWKVDVRGRLEGILPLSSVFLPGSENRRKSEEDEKWMREYLDEGDLISAEVHSIYRDGSVCLNARSAKFGKLGQGLLLTVPPSLVKKQYKNTHFHSLDCGVSLILGSNGNIWLYTTSSAANVDEAGTNQTLTPFSPEEHDNIGRVGNCIKLLHHFNTAIHHSSIQAAYLASLSHPTKEILLPNTSSAIFDTLKVNLDYL